ncbi:MAG: alpha/beta hydrolase [Candidatus Dormibacteraeota bacterium]|nr:alpha/beta hydrolase [Candidatus Dormibacteraeota bacterium]
MAEPADGWLERDGIDIHYLEWGRDAAGLGPAVLFLHGLSSNAQYWGRVADNLSGRRIVALDQRGHGLTGRPPRMPALPDGFAMNELLGDAMFAIQQLGLDRPIVAGHSWGATVALELVARHPDTASALVFIDGPVQSASNLFTWEEGQAIMQPPLPRHSSFAQAVDDCRRDFGTAWGDDLEPFVMSRVMLDGTSFVLTLTSAIRLELLRGLYESPVDHLWTQLEGPAAALLARGGPGRMGDWKETGTKRLEANAPRVEVRWFDTPHDIPLFVPAEIAAEIERMAMSGRAGLSSETAAGQ